MNNKKSKIVLADDHAMTAYALSETLKQQGIEVLHVATDGNKILQFLNGHFSEVDVAVLDINMPNLDGITATPIIKSRYPALKVIILSMYYTAPVIEKVKQCGADSFVHKSDDIHKLIECIHEVMAGKKCFPEYEPKNHTYTNEITEDGFLKVSILSEREKQVVRHIRDGMRTKEIAQTLFLSEYTIDTHRKNILYKLGLKSIADLIRFAIEHKL
jgi:DNA-binding NarL/FixJ family response regulator